MSQLKYLFDDEQVFFESMMCGCQNANQAEYSVFRRIHHAIEKSVGIDGLVSIATCRSAKHYFAMFVQDWRLFCCVLEVGCGVGALDAKLYNHVLEYGQQFELVSRKFDYAIR
jgi:hypothetical protein